MAKIHTYIIINFGKDQGSLAIRPKSNEAFHIWEIIKMTLLAHINQRSPSRLEWSAVHPNVPYRQHYRIPLRIKFTSVPSHFPPQPVTLRQFKLNSLNWHVKVVRLEKVSKSKVTAWVVHKIAKGIQMPSYVKRDYQQLLLLNRGTLN